MRRLYLAGPMRGIPEYNFPAFFEAERQLRQLGFVVENPARVDAEAGMQWQGQDGSFRSLAQQGFNIAETMAMDLAIIARRCDGVCVLPGWELSTGARAEVALAQAIGLPVVALGRDGDGAPRVYEIEVVTRMEAVRTIAQVGWAA